MICFLLLSSLVYRQESLHNGQAVDRLEQAQGAVGTPEIWGLGPGGVAGQSQSRNRSLFLDPAADQEQDRRCIPTTKYPCTWYGHLQYRFLFCPVFSSALFVETSDSSSGITSFETGVPTIRKQRGYYHGTPQTRWKSDLSLICAHVLIPRCHFRELEPLQRNRRRICFAPESCARTDKTGQESVP